MYAAPPTADNIVVMTTPIEHHEDSLQFWEQRVKASRWLILKTSMWGALAAVFGVLGQGWLEDASPIFPFISQNYGIWQGAYLLALLVIFLIWAAAMLQKMSLLQNSKQGRAAQQRIDDYNERLAQKKREAQERREQELKEKEASSSFFKNSARSTKFDY
jgi:heme exporter protein D